MSSFFRAAAIRRDEPAASREAKRERLRLHTSGADLQTGAAAVHVRTEDTARRRRPASKARWATCSSVSRQTIRDQKCFNAIVPQERRSLC